jgi:hypothetical protein
VIMRITFLTFLRAAANCSFIAMTQRTNSTVPEARDRAGVQTTPADCQLGHWLVMQALTLSSAAAPPR